MPPPFQDLDPKAKPPDFERLLDRFPWERKVSCVHVHRWPVRESQWRGHRSLQSIWYSQTRQLGWSDIAQHLTIAPDGWLWTGRDWNRPPCSTPDGNGDSKTGPFMISLVADCDRMDEACRTNQYTQLVNVIAHALRHFELSTGQVQFHYALAEQNPSNGAVPTSLPALREKIEARGRELQALAQQESAAPASAIKQPFGEEAEAWYQFITISNCYRHKLQLEPADAHTATGA